MTDQLYLTVLKQREYVKNDHFADEKAMFTFFHFDKNVVLSSLDKNDVDFISDSLDVLYKYRKEFLTDKADRIYFSKNFLLVSIVNNKYPNTGYSIHINLNKFQTEKVKTCNIL